ncbi:MAG: hypothetical protein ACK4GN_12755 [Runella sp.]
MKLATFEDDKLLEEIVFQFQLVKRKVATLQTDLEHARAAHAEIKARFERLENEYKNQISDLQNAKNEVRILKTENKHLRQKELSLKEKLNNFKQLSNIVKNPKNTQTVAELNTKLDDYIRYVEEAIALLKTL